MPNKYWIFLREFRLFCVSATCRVTVTGHSAITGTAAYTDAPAEYFNLQGIPVANPSGGVFLRRQGDRVSKVTLP